MAQPELKEEIYALQAIYGDHVIKPSPYNYYVLRLTIYDAALRMTIPSTYPAEAPRFEATEFVAADAPENFSSTVLELAKEVIPKIWTPGGVCLFDLIQELELQLPNRRSETSGDERETQELLGKGHEDNFPGLPTQNPLPEWFLSEPITEKKSSFLARACIVRSPEQASGCLESLLLKDKKCAKATHNIWAYRMRSTSTTCESQELIYQDYDDDGESAAGSRLLHLLQIMNVWDVLVVVSRWYGGVKLGPDRFKIISNVARQALTKGGWRNARK